MYVRHFRDSIYYLLLILYVSIFISNNNYLKYFLNSNKLHTENDYKVTVKCLIYSDEKTAQDDAIVLGNSQSYFLYVSPRGV